MVDYISYEQRRRHIVELSEEQRQMVLLALAKLSIERPGWLDAIEELALTMDNRNAEGKPGLLFNFRQIHGGNPMGNTRKERIALVVRSLYADLDVGMLEEILAIGRGYEAKISHEKVLDVNEALADLIAQKRGGQ